MMCAGVQKVSRPIDMCHEISHGPPIIPHTTPATMHQIVHGTDSTFAPTPAPTRAVIGGLAICAPKGIDCPIASNSSSAHRYGIFAALWRVYTAQPFLQTDFPHLALTIPSQIRIASPLVFSPPKYMEHLRVFFVFRCSALPLCWLFQWQSPGGPYRCAHSWST